VKEIRSAPRVTQLLNGATEMADRSVERRRFATPRARPLDDIGASVAERGRPRRASVKAAPCRGVRGQAPRIRPIPPAFRRR
jgi:hypothetical protein